MSSSSYHEPVMLQECLEGLQIKPEGVYVDVTFGGGGHSRAILQHLEQGRLLAFDQDEDAARQAADITAPQFTFVKANFRLLKRYLKVHDVEQVDGILADLGISSHQINEAERGFSTRFDAELDMRMSRTQDFSAKQLLATYSERDIHRILGQYGEVRNARTLAQAIVAQRIRQPIETVAQLKEILNKYAPRGKEFKYYAQVFQALRIEVNDELKALEEMIEQCTQVLKPGGRLVVMSYHSLEDRIVKNYINKGKFFGEVEKDIYGNEIKPFLAFNKKAIEPAAEEISRNSRARSAKLRIAIRL